MSPKDRRVVLSAWVEPVLRDYVREAARLSGLEFSRWVERAVRQAMAREYQPHAAKRFIASAYTNRGGCTRRTRLDQCEHKHKTFVAAVKCARRHQKAETKPRWWNVDTVVWLPASVRPR